MSSSYHTLDMTKLTTSDNLQVNENVFIIGRKKVWVPKPRPTNPCGANFVSYLQTPSEISPFHYVHWCCGSGSTREIEHSDQFCLVTSITKWYSGQTIPTHLLSNYSPNRTIDNRTAAFSISLAAFRLCCSIGRSITWKAKINFRKQKSWRVHSCQVWHQSQI